jgi:16S rRNA (guanine966-N2)-methyltransferase
MRIVAGRLGGLRLVAPKGQATRPTGDRVKEALFAILGPMVREGDSGRVLDLYAGSGALGLEALSRGATHVVFVEEARTALEALRANVAHVKADSSTTVVPKSVERALTALEAFATAESGRFSLIVADPPYADVRDGKAVRAIQTVIDRGLLATGGRLVLELASVDSVPAFAGLGSPDTRRYGDTSLAFYDVP